MNKFRINLLCNVAEKNNKKENLLFFIAFVIASTYFNYKSYKEVINRKTLYGSELIKIESKYRQNISLANLKNEVNYINNLLNIRSFSWSNFLSNLEKITPAGISISNITPTFTTKDVRIEGIVLSTDNIVNFMKNLQNSTFFSDVFIMEQREIELKEITENYITVGFTDDSQFQEIIKINK